MELWATGSELEFGSGLRIQQICSFSAFDISFHISSLTVVVSAGSIKCIECLGSVPVMQVLYHLIDKPPINNSGPKAQLESKRTKWNTYVFSLQFF
jgi:hypothetical protein